MLNPEISHWYVLQATYGRERKACECMEGMEAVL